MLPVRRAAGWIGRWASGLRFPQLLALTLVLLALDLALPDPVPILDEVVLVLLAALLGSLRRRDEKRNGTSER